MLLDPYASPSNLRQVHVPYAYGVDGLLWVVGGGGGAIGCWAFGLEGRELAAATVGRGRYTSRWWVASGVLVRH